MNKKCLSMVHYLHALGCNCWRDVIFYYGENCNNCDPINGFYLDLSDVIVVGARSGTFFLTTEHPLSMEGCSAVETIKEMDFLKEIKRM